MRKMYAENSKQIQTILYLGSDKNWRIFTALIIVLDYNADSLNSPKKDRLIKIK